MMESMKHSSALSFIIGFILGMIAVWSFDVKDRATARDWEKSFSDMMAKNKEKEKLKRG